MRRQASACSSFQMPASSGEMRPSGSTAEASVMTSPKPPVACEPRCTRCQSFGAPSTAEYWHIGASQTRLRVVIDRSVRGSNSFDTGFSSWGGASFSATNRLLMVFPDQTGDTRRKDIPASLRIKRIKLLHLLQRREAETDD